MAIAHHHAVMLGMRLTEIWLWPEPFADTEPLLLSGRYVTAFTQPPKWNGSARAFEWDGDPWWINGLGHALFGSELYLAARRCRFDPVPAALLATAGRAVWEYGYEANGVRPSALDLVYTPLAGAVLGEMRYWAYRGAAVLPGVPKAVLRGLMDPFGEVERALGSPC